MNRKSDDYMEIVGITSDNTVIILDDTFEYGGGFKGATYIAVERLTQDVIDEYNSDDYVLGYAKDEWKIAVENDNTADSLADYAENLKYEVGQNELYYLGDDDSYRHDMDYIVEKMSDENRKIFEETIGVKGKDFVDWSVVSCGRVGEDCYKWEWKVLLRPDLLDEIKKFEKKEAEMELDENDNLVEKNGE